MSFNVDRFQLILFARQEVPGSLLIIAGTVKPRTLANCKITGVFYRPEFFLFIFFIFIFLVIMPSRQKAGRFMFITHAMS